MTFEGLHNQKICAGWGYHQPQPTFGEEPQEPHLQSLHNYFKEGCTTLVILRNDFLHCLTRGRETYNMHDMNPRRQCSERS